MILKLYTKIQKPINPRHSETSKIIVKIVEILVKLMKIYRNTDQNLKKIKKSW